MLDDLKRMLAEHRLKEEAIYAHVINEIESGYRRDGLWARALAESKFDERETKSRYIKLRVQSIKDELNLAQIAESRTEPEVAVPTKSERTASVGDGSYRDARSTYSVRSTYSEIPSGGIHTEKTYSCNNCDYHGQLMLKKAGLLGVKSIMICPKCGAGS